MLMLRGKSLTMKKINSAVTLVELILSTLIVAMVVAGVFAAEYALRRINESGAQDIKTSLKARAVAESVRATVKTLQGDLSQGDNACYTGIVHHPDISQTLCFRYDMNSTAGTCTDDTWKCYTQIGVDVYSCIRTTASWPTLPTACGASDTWVGQLASDQFTSGAVPSHVAKSATGEYYFQMTFIGRDDPSLAKSMTNPETRITIRESAPGF
jgi:Tfp pilus assembly protein PilV